MNSIKKTFRLCVLLLFFACSNSGGESYHHDGHIDSKLPQEAVINHGPTKAHTAFFVCPMHCEGSGGDKGGICPYCGADYVLLKEHKKDGHTH